MELKNRLLIFAVIAALVFGCSIEKQINHHNKQAARHAAKAIKKGYEPQADTVYILDTVFVAETRHDTTFVDIIGDTIIIEQERLRIKYVRFADSVYIEGVCIADTIIKEIPITVQETVYINRSFFDYIGVNTRLKRALFWVLLAVIGVLFVYKAIIK